MMAKILRTPLFWWLLGLGVGVGVAIGLPEGELAAARPVVLGATVLGFGVIGEMIAGSRNHPIGVGQAAVPQRDPLVPDGKIAIRAVSGYNIAPNRADTRFGRYEALPQPGTIAPVPRPERPRSRLSGRVVISTIFVSSEYRPWTDEEIGRSLTAVERACRWLEREAIRWKASVKLEVAGGYFALPSEPFEEPDINLADQGHDLGLVAIGEWEWILKGLNHAVPALGATDFVAFIEAVEQEFEEADEVVWLVFPRQAGRSFALPRHEALTGGANLAVCYAVDSNFPEPLRGAEPRVDPATIAHEFLHLFHASDKYGKRLDRFERGTVTRFDIMRMSPARSFRSNRVDLATAREIGWA